MKRTQPPFRADMVGSLLRPAAIKDARARHATNEIDAAGLRNIEDREIEAIVFLNQLFIFYTLTGNRNMNLSTTDIPYRRYFFQLRKIGTQSHWQCNGNGACMTSYFSVPRI